MKNLLIIALKEAYSIMEKQVPLTRKSVRFVDIDDVMPINIPSFMKENGIPDTAYFHGIDNGYDGYSRFVLAYDVDVPTDEKYKNDFRRKRFTDIAWRKVYEVLTNNGYVRTGYNTGLLKPFNDTTVYDMYINKQYDRLVDYYSLPFKKV